ncbi:MAG TPA: PilW family protein [Candidatus Competibacteraceae bacterium]|nr:PilW family protein [Candidatus Competibacteraceae bacterium]
MVEILVGLALGLLITSGFISMFLSSKSSYNATERNARLQENGRIALNILASEIRHANFWGQLLNADNIIKPSITFSGCQAWASEPTGQRLMSTTDPNSGAPFDTCLSATEIAKIPADTSVIAIKRVSNRTIDYTTLPANEWYLRSHGAGGELKIKGTGDSAKPADREDWLYEPKLYFVKTDANGLPELCRVDSIMRSQQTICLVQGVEMLHIEYGVDTDSNGVPNCYSTDPTACGATPGDTVSASIYLLMRDLEEDRGYTNKTTYRLGSLEVDVDDHYHRAVFNTTVIAENKRYLPVR